MRRAEARARSVSVLRGRLHHLRRYGRNSLNCRIRSGVAPAAWRGSGRAVRESPQRYKVFSRVLKISDRRVECAAAVGRWPLSAVPGARGGEVARLYLYGCISMLLHVQALCPARLALPVHCPGQGRDHKLKNFRIGHAQRSLTSHFGREPSVTKTGASPNLLGAEHQTSAGPLPHLSGYLQLLLGLRRRRRSPRAE